jgi:hypothetical protein
MNEAVRKLVRRRARNRCEYCGLPEAYAPVVPLHIEHITARKHGGQTRPINLALGCYHCNFHKQTDLVGVDPLTRKRVTLFNPRRHSWRAHFQWEGVLLFGKSAIGRTTVEVLAMNDEEMLDLRTTLLEEGAFPW